MTTKLLLTAIAFAAVPSMTMADDSISPSIVRAVRYQPIAAVLNSEETPDAYPRVFHRRPCPPIHKYCPPKKPPCPPKPPHCTTACPPVKCPEVEIGSIVTAPTNFLGKEAGHVLIRVGYTTMECDIIEWCHNYVKFQVPNMGLSTSLATQIEIVRPDGSVVRCYRVCLVPKPGLIVQPVIQSSPAASPRHPANAANTDGLQLHTGSSIAPAGSGGATAVGM